MSKLDKLPQVSSSAATPTPRTCRAKALVDASLTASSVAGVGNGNLTTPVRHPGQASKDGIRWCVLPCVPTGSTTSASSPPAETLNPQKARVLLMLA